MEHAMTPGFAWGPPRGRKGPRGDWFAAASTGEEPGGPGEDEPRRRGRHRHRDFGPGPGAGPGGPGWGPPPGGPWGPPPFRGGRRRDRGDVRAAVLLLLAEKPRHGYEIITELADRSDGRWRASPGSVYPILKRLAREGLVEPSHEEGRRIFTLTEQGRALVEEQREAWGEPWAAQGGVDDDVAVELWDEARQLAAATWQVAQTGDANLVKATLALLAKARRDIYRLLADA